MSSKNPPKSKKPTGQKFDGIRSVAEMLNVMEPAARNKLLAQLNEKDPKVTTAIRDKMFVFQDLTRLSPRSFQTLLKEIPPRKLALSLRNVSEEFRAFLFKNLSQRAAEHLQEEVVALGPQKLSEVTSAQNEMVQIARRLIAEGKIQFD
ncbi:MAG: hypothetical protein HYX41_02630 [Bdellovibrio sp.]|nr:hypothetical protein [Bdellovibrio sp.]